MLTATISVPKVGDKVYVPTALYLSHGKDDRLGGIATVSDVKPNISAGKTVPFVCVLEHPGVSYNWEFLAEQQTKLSKRFGTSRARPDPDWSSASNER